MYNKYRHVNLIYCNVKRVHHHHYYYYFFLFFLLLLLGPLCSFIGSSCFYLLVRFVLIKSPKHLWVNSSCWNFSSCFQSQLRRNFCERKGEKIKLWYSDYGGVDKALNGAKEVWMDAVACELKQSNYCFIIVFFSFFSANRAAEPHSERLWHLGGQALCWTLQV